MQVFSSLARSMSCSHSLSLSRLLIPVLNKITLLNSRRSGDLVAKCSWTTVSSLIFSLSPFWCAHKTADDLECVLAERASQREKKREKRRHIHLDIMADYWWYNLRNCDWETCANLISIRQIVSVNHNKTGPEVMVSPVAKWSSFQYVSQIQPLTKKQ